MWTVASHGDDRRSRFGKHSLLAQRARTFLKEEARNAGSCGRKRFPDFMASCFSLRMGAAMRQETALRPNRGGSQMRISSAPLRGRARVWLRPLPKTPCHEND